MQQQARIALQQALPQGARTANQHIKMLYNNDDEHVGILWFSVDAASKTSFCFELRVDQHMQRQGYGRQLLALWEGCAARLGAETMALHVFSNNIPARSLYQSDGFAVKSTNFFV